ncbi:MAG: argininosuccinate lyase [Gammaproteobacteria bacterium]|nr:argininosuccinate lyase [Gammaproteobacteria bacterium]
MNSHSKKLWGGRFTQATNSMVEKFSASVSFDQRLYRQDIVGSIAHARMLSKVGVIDESEFNDIRNGLNRILSQIEAGEFEWSDEFEDVHMNIEKRLTDDIGEAGKKLHTGRSRNDQVATDLRLYTRDAVDLIIDEIKSIQLTLLDFAEAEAETIMPGYTHLQIAQPIVFGHHLMAWFEMLDRDRQRFIDARKRLNQSPLGAAALAGTSFPINREMTADELGFDAVMRNSLDAVSDRDFAIEFAAHSAITMVHLSRIGEEMVLWASEAYKLISLSDQFTTGSSIMPQKKNPDVAELVRGKSARAVGNLQTLLVLMKGQPLAYNRDNQEDKEALFDSIDTVFASLEIMHGMIQNLEPDRERMRAAALEGYSTATDLADYLVTRDVPFRDAHAVVGNIVRHCIDNECTLEALSLDDMRRFHSMLDEGALRVIRPEGSVASRDHTGATAPRQVRLAVQEGRKRLS